jgi:hypothetical protein
MQLKQFGTWFIGGGQAKLFAWLLFSWVVYLFERGSLLSLQVVI